MTVQSPQFSSQSLLSIIANIKSQANEHKSTATLPAK
jgi:hypothetical protein